MATSIDPPTPGSQLVRPGNVYDDDWRQVADDEWRQIEDDELPTLISSVENNPKDHTDSEVHTELNEPLVSGTVSGGSHQSSRQGSQQASQQPPIKMLIRPVSSGRDPAAGFSFTKAKPIHQLDFRRPKQALAITQPPGPAHDLESMPVEPNSRQSPSPAIAIQAGRNVPDISARQTPVTEDCNTPVPKETPPVTLQSTIPPYSQDYSCPPTVPTSGPIMLNFASTQSPLNQDSATAEEFRINAKSTEAKVPGPLNIIVPDQGNSDLIASAHVHNPIDITTHANQPQVNMQNRSRQASREPLTPVAGSPKVTKCHPRKPKIRPAKEGALPSSHTKGAYTDDDLFRLLMYRRSQGQQELEHFRATQQQKDAEIQNLREISSQLSSQLQEVEQRESLKTVELSNIKARKPIWERKIKNLSDYIKGLTNDHKRLREDADDLRKQHEDIFVAREEWHSTLREAQKSIEQERVQSQHLNDGAQVRIEALLHTVKSQDDRLKSDDSLLVAERERSQRLEEQMSSITAGHGQLLELFTSHRDSITERLDKLLHQAQTIVPPEKSSELQSDNLIRPMLEQCLEMVQRLQVPSTVKPDELQNLNDTVDRFIQGIALSVEACEEGSKSVEAGQKQLAITMQDQFRALSGNILSEQALSQQISDLREVRAAVRERLQASENSLTVARQEVVALRLRGEEQSRTIVALETDVAKAQSQPAEEPQALLRIQELDSRNKDLQSDIITLRQEAGDLRRQLQQSSSEARNVTDRLSTAQEKLETNREETTRLQEEKSVSERQAALEREQLRQDLSKAANMQLSNMQSEHMNIVQQFKIEKSAGEEKLKKFTMQIASMKTEKIKSEKENNCLLREARNDKEAVIGTRNALQLQIKETEAQMLEKNNKYADLQARLTIVKNQMGAKDIEIKKLQDLLATRSQSPRSIELNDTLSGVRPTRNGHGPHHDSQQASFTQSPSIQPPSIQPTKSTSSRHFTKRQQTVEDSQPTEKPSFVNLDDFLSETPFADYTQEESQFIAGEDTSHLFPSTPGAGSHIKDIDYSLKSVFHTTVVSETQRLEQQTFRESTPHAGLQSTNRPPSQPRTRTHSMPVHIDTVPRSSATSPLAKATSSLRDPNNPIAHREASIKREPAKPRGSVKDPGQRKRDTLAAGFDDTNSQARPSKLPKADLTKQAKVSGGASEDSQSSLFNGIGRKLTRKPSGPRKVDKFARRFAQS